jgi:hypothetical protein
MRPRALSAIPVVAAVLVGASARAAEDPSDAQLFSRSVAALERGAPTEAIDGLELLADRGVKHPDASFDRALAYIRRAESSRKQPGDLGRAAAALSEAIALRGDDEAEQLLGEVREEIARRRVRRGSAPIAVTQGLGWAVVGLLPENAWAITSAFGSLLLTAGLALAAWSHRASLRVPRALLIGIGSLLLVTFGALTLAARHRRLSHHAAVVVAPDVRLTDLAGRAPSAEASGHETVPEGAEVSILDRKGTRVSIEWDGAVGWVSSESILPMPRP